MKEGRHLCVHPTISYGGGWVATEKQNSFPTDKIQIMPFIAKAWLLGPGTLQTASDSGSRFEHDMPLVPKKGRDCQSAATSLIKLQSMSSHSFRFTLP